MCMVCKNQILFGFGFPVLKYSCLVGPGSFFKSHVDTPKSGKMFGSLVVALPTKHEGGTSPLRHHGREWVFNSADLVSPHWQNTESPRAAFVAFFGDIEHEVTEVKSGYRVILTYNLYFEDSKSTFVPQASPTMLPLDDKEVKIKKSLKALLKNIRFLPRGLLVGFGLSHLYPIPVDSPTGIQKINLRQLGENLKGTDAAIKHACDSLSLNVSVKTVYYDSKIEGVSCLLDKIADPDIPPNYDVDIIARLQKECRGLLVFDGRMSAKDLEETLQGGQRLEPILWLKPLTKRNPLASPYVAYGNEPSLQYVYGEICLLLKVESFKNRKIH